MNTRSRVVRIERSLNVSGSATNPLPQNERVKLIYVDHGLAALENSSCGDEEKYIKGEQAHILTELHGQYGDFDENSIEWIAVVFVDPFADLREEGVRFEVRA